MNNNQTVLHQLIDESTIDLNMEVKNKKESIEKLAEMLLRVERINDKDIFIQDILDREEIESTNMGMGVAIPHGESSTIIKNSIAISRLSQPIPWKPGEDEKLVSVIFLLAVCDNPNRNKVHLELLSKIATLLLKENFLNLLFNTTSKSDLILQISKLIGEN